MVPDRFNAEPIAQEQQLVAPPQAAFFLFGAGTAVATPSAMEWFYQQLYLQAQQANRQPASRELFAVMN